MKIVKRDGHIVDYDPSKIRTAIKKANVEVKPKERATEDEINAIIQYIEELNKKRILVEDIQDTAQQIGDSKEQIKQVATISAQDEEVGNLIADVFEEIGKDGTITVEE